MEAGNCIEKSPLLICWNKLLLPTTAIAHHATGLTFLAKRTAQANHSQDVMNNHNKTLHLHYI